LEVTANLLPSKVADQWSDLSATLCWVLYKDSPVSSYMGAGLFYFGENKIERRQQSIVFHTVAARYASLHQVAVICFIG
jgi:hypothetical protein